MAKFIQISLHQSQAAQDLLYQTAKEQEASILLVSEQYRNPNNSGWHSDNRGDAAIHVLPRMRAGWNCSLQLLLLAKRIA